MPMFVDSVLGEGPPYFNFLILPDAEQEGSSEQVMSGLGEIWSAVRTFKHAWRLFSFCIQERPEEDDWKLIAARDGAWSISNLGYTIEYFRGSLGAYPTLRSMIDHKELRAAQKMYAEFFPHFPSIRHSLAHGPDMTMNQQKRDEHYYQGPFRSDGQIIEGDRTKIMVKHSLNGRTYQTTFSGQLLSYEINEDTLRKMVQIKDRFFLGFRLVEEVSRKTPHWRPDASS